MTFAWTASSPNGASFVTLGSTSVAQAAQGVVRKSSIWVAPSNFNFQTKQHRFYAFSPVPVAPEPTSLSPLAASGPLLCRRRRSDNVVRQLRRQPWGYIVGEAQRAASII